jgi:glycosyltransferase involved in cell wall biosynthesis
VTYAPMKVLHVVAGNLFGGIEQLLLTFARESGLVSGMEPGFAVCFEGRLSEKLLDAGFRPKLLSPVRCRFPWTVIQAQNKLRQLLSSERWDVVVCHSAWSQAIFGSVARAANVSQVFWLHDVPSKRHWIERWASMSRPDLAICNSHFTASYLPRIFSSVPTVISYPVVGPTSPDASGRAASEEVKRHDHVVTIVHATRMQPGKGHHVLLNALAEIRSVAGWRCWFVGGPQRPSETRFAEELSRRSEALNLSSNVSFLGFRDDVPFLMSQADLYCQPNEKPDAFGIAFVEALRSGLPVVTSQFGGAVEIVDDTCGRLTPPGDSMVLAAVLKRLVCDSELRRTLATGAKIRAAAFCDPKRQLEILRDTLVTLIR